jgi:succinyl-CoA synthetase beta subunit
MKALDFFETEKLMRKYGFDFVKSRFCLNKNEAKKLADRLKYPLVLKISSRTIFHKTELAAVETGIESKSQLERAFERIVSSLEKQKLLDQIDGFLLQEQVKGRELAIGMKRDPSFGPVLMFALGGIFVELLKDASFRIAPVSAAEAKAMIREIKGRELLGTFRGQEAVNLEKIVKLITALSRLSLEEDIKEVDLNPVVANKKGALVADARFLVEDEIV